jgi:hypothetical protein
MENTTGALTPEKLMVGSHYAYNIARGTLILGDKWNAAPFFRPIVGDGNPAVLEDWYYAVWSYHGFSIGNHPLNAEYDMLRAPYRCDGTQSRADYPYQELIFGCLNNPPSPIVGTDRSPLWAPQPATLPDLSSEQVYTAMSLDNFLFNTPGMDIPRPEPSRTDSTPLTGDRSAILGAPQLSTSVTDVSFQLVKDDTFASDAQSVEISNPGTGPLPWMAVPSDGWIIVERSQGVALGSDLGGTSASFSIRTNAEEMDAGVYEGTVSVIAPYSGGSPVTIRVRLSVYERSFIPGLSKS